MAVFHQSAMNELSLIYRAKLRDPTIPNVEDMECVKEACRELVGILGVWCTTKPIADLGTAIIQVSAKEELGADEFDGRITHQSLAPTADRTNLMTLSYLGREKRDVLFQSLRLAERILSNWLWLAIFSGCGAMFSMTNCVPGLRDMLVPGNFESVDSFILGKQ